MGLINNLKFFKDGDRQVGPMTQSRLNICAPFKLQLSVTRHVASAIFAYVTSTFAQTLQSERLVRVMKVCLKMINAELILTIFQSWFMKEVL